MSGRRKKENVSASFHYLVRRKRLENGDEEIVKFTESEFQQLLTNIETLPKCDLQDTETVKRLRTGYSAPLENFLRVNDRTAFGVFRAPYSGHSYDNSAKGKIPADSVSLRQFHYTLYLSKSGRIYLGAQYLG